MLLAIYLRVIGVFLCVAFLAVVMPTSWMAAIHEAVGLGIFPEAKLTEYLTRSASMLYGGWGVLYIYLSFDIPRYLRLLYFLCWLVGAFAIAMLVLDLILGMPVLWTLGEGPFVLAHVVLLRYLLNCHERKLRPSDARG